MKISLQDVTNVRPEYAETFGPPGWVTRPVSGVAAVMEDDEWSYLYPDDDRVFGLALAQVAELAKQEIAVARTHGLGGVRAVTWKVLQEESKKSEICQQLIKMISDGMPEEKESWHRDLWQYYSWRKQLLVMEGVILCGDRPLIPAGLRAQVLDILHAGHAGTSSMQARTTQAMFWPGMSQDIAERRAGCRECTYRAPSQPAQQPQAPTVPDHPFSHVCMDFFHLDGYYLAVCDRFSNWLSVFKFRKDDTKAVISMLRQYFARYGIAKEISTDGQRTLCSAEMEDFLARWGVRHRISSAYHPHANKHAEVAVKQVKRLVEGNLGPRGEIDTDRLARALLEHRNTPDPQTGLSPAMILYGRQLRGFLPSSTQTQVKQEWRIDVELREKAFAKKHSQMAERLSAGTKQLSELEIGDEVVVQDPSEGGKAGRWSKSGTVVERLLFDAYLIQIHGSRRVTKRNRIHIRKIRPFIPDEKIIPVTHPHAGEIPEETKTEVRERYTAIQPPRKWKRLSPEPHRQQPVGRPGQDVVGRLKEQEKQEELRHGGLRS